MLIGAATFGPCSTNTRTLRRVASSANSSAIASCRAPLPSASAPCLVCPCNPCAPSSPCTPCTCSGRTPSGDSLPALVATNTKPPRPLPGPKVGLDDKTQRSPEAHRKWCQQPNGQWQAPDSQGHASIRHIHTSPVAHRACAAFNCRGCTANFRETFPPAPPSPPSSRTPRPLPAPSEINSPSQ